jgi:hypothetical protein
MIKTMNKRLASALELAIAKYIWTEYVSIGLAVWLSIQRHESREQKACDVLSWHDVGSEIARAYIAAKEKAGA